MKVKLISYSQPAPEFVDQGIDTIQDLIVYCARVSNPSNQFNTMTTDKLISYLVKNAHWSPFSMATICLELETTRDISRQFLRHWSLAQGAQEYSQRYANPLVDLDFVLREARLQDPTNRQNSIDLDMNDDSHRKLAYQWENYQKLVIEAAKNAYDWAIDHGIAKEQARAVLPEGNTVTRFIINGYVRNWITYLMVRTQDGVQKEHRELAREIAKAIHKMFPAIDQFT